MISSKLGQILVVDDEVELKNALVEMLNAQGYEALGCTSGAEALSALGRQNFDVLLSDLMMPEMDGTTLLRRGLEIDQHLVCIIMTGQGTIQTAVEAMKIGAFDYVLKPFRLQALLPVLTRAINVRRLNQENLQLRETVAIHELCQTIAFTLDPQTVLSKLADAAQQQSEADEVSILLPTDDGSELYVAAVRGENRERLLGERVPLEQSISSWVARERLPLLLKGQVNDARFTALWPRSEISSAISVPMQCAGKLVGVININTVSSPRPFTLGQMKALTILASTAAAALESASLYGQVRQAEEKYRSIFDNAVEGIFQSTPQGRFITVNPSMARILGYDSPEEVIETITDIAQQVYVDPARRAQATHLQEEQGVLQGFEFEAYRKDGEKIWLSENRRAVRDGNDVEIYREGTLENITERKRIEQALRESEDRYRDLVEHSHDLICTHDLEGRILSVNQTAVKALGYEHEVLLSRNICEGLLPSVRNKFDDYIAELLKEGVAHGLMAVQTRTGEKRIWEYTNTLRTEGVAELIVRGTAHDVTEQKHAEAELRKSEAQYRRLLDTTYEGVMVFDAEMRVTYVNQRLVEMLGVSAEEVIGHSALNFVVTTSRSDVEQQWQHRKDGIKDQYDLCLQRKDGSDLWVIVCATPILDERGEFIGSLSMLTDITERKRAEEKLQEVARSREESRALLDTILSTAPIGFAFHNCELEYERINETLAAINGLAMEQHIGRTLHDVLPEMAAMLEPLLRRVLETREPLIDLEMSGETPADPGQQHYWLLSSYPVRTPGGEMLGVGVLVSEITERKRAQEALLQSEQRYRLLFERNPHPMWVFNLETLAFLEVNDAAIHHYGYTREEFLAMTIKEIRPAEDIPNLLDNVSRDLPQYEEAGVWQHRKKDGTIIDVEITAHELAFYGRPAQIVLAYDVTERRSLEEQLRQSQKLEAVGQLAGGVAHDFNNLLTVITGYSDLSLRRLDKDNPLRSNLEEIRKAGERAASLTRQLLAFSRKQVLQPKVLQLNAIVADVDKMLRRLIGEDIDSLTVLEPSLGQVKADPGQIEQVILNLAVNARDAMPKGGKLTIETANVYLDNQYVRRHTAILPGHYVMLAVSDTGCGIDAETQVRMFEPFFTTKEQGKGTGLGLSTVYGIVKQSGGNIWVYSEVGKGTTFKIYLPRIDGVTEMNEARDTPAELPQGRETVLLTEDEEQVRQMIRKILEMNGYHVLEASGGDEALAIYKQHEGQIDLIMTDVVMPQMSGRELAQSLEVLHPGIKVLYMSGYTDDAIVRHGLLDQEIAFLQKPFTPDALMRKVREVLDASPQDEQVLPGLLTGGA
jgi:PAS domain S-box-containing protein